MLIFVNTTDLNKIPNNMPPEVKERIVNIITNLDIHYGYREMDEDGGCVVLIEDGEDYLKTLKDELGIEIGVSVMEYVEIIKTQTLKYLDCLILSNNEYASSIILKQDMAVQAILDELN